MDIESELIVQSVLKNTEQKLAKEIKSNMEGKMFSRAVGRRTAAYKYLVREQSANLCFLA